MVHVEINPIEIRQFSFKSGIPYEKCCLFDIVLPRFIPNSSWFFCHKIVSRVLFSPEHTVESQEWAETLNALSFIGVSVAAAHIL